MSGCRRIFSWDFISFKYHFFIFHHKECSLFHDPPLKLSVYLYKYSSITVQINNLFIFWKLISFKICFPILWKDVCVLFFATVLLRSPRKRTFCAKVLWCGRKHFWNIFVKAHFFRERGHLSLLVKRFIYITSLRWLFYLTPLFYWRKDNNSVKDKRPQNLYGNKT